MCQWKQEMDYGKLNVQIIAYKLIMENGIVFNGNWKLSWN